jgi:hypothetical protein
MKTFLAGLQNSIQTSYSNNGKTTILGRAMQKNINGQSVIGPQLTGWIDFFVQSSLYPVYPYYNPTTGHLFVLGSLSTVYSGINMYVAMYTFNNSAGVPAYVGKVNFNLPNAAATTPALRGFNVYENGSNITPVITTTGSVVINGGTMIAYNLTAASFTVGGTILYPASSASQAGGIYFLQDPAAIGVNHVATTGWGQALPQFSTSGTVKTKVWQANGTFALPQFYSWDLSIAPTVAGTILNGVNAQTTLYAGTSPSAFFTMGASNNGYSVTNGDCVVLMAGTGAVPTGFTAWTATALQTAAVNTYFVRDLQLVSGNYYFNLSSATGGAAITPTSSTSSFTMMRAFGISTSMFSLKTGILPAITGGTLIGSNSMGYCNPISSPANVTLQGLDCIYFGASTAMYMGKISDLTSGTTNWPSLISAGISLAGTGTDIIVPTAALFTYSGQMNANDIDKFIYTINTSTFIMKSYQGAGSPLTNYFGGVTSTYLEGTNPITIEFGLATITGICDGGGWLFATSQTVGQRGLFFGDMNSDATFGVAGVISPVLNVPVGTVLKYINTIEQLFNYTDSLNFWIRNAATSTDASFNSGTLPVGSPINAGTTSNGWTNLQTASDMSAIAFGPYFQLCVTFQILTLLANTPAQVFDIEYACLPPGESSDYWATNVDNTTQGLGSPSYAAWYMQTAYASTVPTLYARVYDTSGNLIFNQNTSANPTSFQYSTNGGTSWTALGTIPNTVGTLVRVLVTPTPSVAGFASIRES